MTMYEFCDIFMDIDDVHDLIDDNDYYNYIFDLCVRIEDRRDYSLEAEKELREIASRYKTT